MNTVDTRVTQMSGLITDARAIAEDMRGEVYSNPLTDAVHYLNWALSAVERARTELESHR